MVIPVRTALITTHQVPLLVHAGPHWQVWISYAPKMEAGTYLVLREDGSIMRETLSPTGEVINVVTIKP